MYWIDANTGDIIASVLDEETEKGIQLSQVRNKKIKKHGAIIAMHTLYIDNYFSMGYTRFETQIKVIFKMTETYKIYFKEV